MKKFAFLAVFLLCSTTANAASIVLTGHDPDFHATTGTAAQQQGAINLNNTFIDFILDPLFNPIVASGTSKFLFVESNIAVPSGHRVGENGIIASGYTTGVAYEKHDAATLAAELLLLGSKYAGIVIASDFGGLLTQNELDILNASSGQIVDFLNNDGGGLYAMAQSGGGSGQTTGGWFDFLPFVVSSTALNQSESGTTVTAFGASLGLTNADVNTNFSHNIFGGAFGLNVVDNDSAGNILTLAGRGKVDPNTGVNVVPVPASLGLTLTSLALFGLIGRRRSRRSFDNLTKAG